MIRRVLFAAAAAVLVAGCNGSNSVPPAVVATPTPTPSPTPNAPQHVYVGNTGGGQIAQYTLPLTAASAANFTFNSSGILAMGVDASGNLIAGSNTGQLTFFPAPLSAASVPTATFANGSATSSGQVAVTGAGDIFVSSNAVNAYGFTHPFTNASTPSSTIATPGTDIIGVALDAAANLYLSNAGAATSNLYVYAPPYTGVPITTPGLAATAYRKIALNSTQLFATSVAGATGQVDVYTLPITSSSAPAFAIATGVNGPEAVAFDAAGNLYVGNDGNHSITVYAPPFSAASTPTVTLSVTGALFALTIGK
jgi:hypothetical protein